MRRKIEIYLGIWSRTGRYQKGSAGTAQEDEDGTGFSVTYLLGILVEEFPAGHLGPFRKLSAIFGRWLPGPVSLTSTVVPRTTAPIQFVLSLELPSSPGHFDFHWDVIPALDHSH